MKKVIVIGCPGAGKSTLARQLSLRLDLPVHHLDALFWKPGWVGVPKEEQRQVQKQLVQEPEWIIDGNYGGTMEIRLQAADAVIFLDMSRLRCMYQAAKRTIQYRRKKRPDMAEGCPERFDPAFFRWIWQFQKNKRPAIIEALAKLQDEKEVVVLRTPREASGFLEKIGASH